MCALAATYQDAELNDKAKDLLERVLTGSRAKLGPDHVDTLTALNNLAVLHARCGRNEEAIPLLEQVLEAQRAKVEPDHIDLLISMHNLAVSYRDSGRYDQAEALLTDALERAKRTLGFAHDFTQSAIPNLAELHNLQGKPEATEPLLREIVEFNREHEGPESQVYDDQLAFLFRNLIRQKKFGEAEQIARQRLAIRLKNTPDAWAVFLLKSQIGESLLGQEKFAEAEPLLVEGYDGLVARQEEIGSSAPTRQSAVLGNLVKLYEAWGKADEAAKWREVLEQMQQ
jgi:tetratricopeptide (TPR) repeat protein